MARYAKDKKQHSKRNKIISIILALIILIIIGLLLINKLVANRSQEIGTLNPIVEGEQNNVQEEIVNVDNIPEKMGNYKVLGKIVIDKIGVDNNILEVCEDDSLKLSVAKYAGSGVNEPGNIVIGGHNWGGMFKRLSELTRNVDTFYIINRETGTKVKYLVDDIFTCGPYDLWITDQRNDGKKWVTLFTCTPSGAGRVVCTAYAV